MKNSPALPNDPESGNPHEVFYWYDDPTLRMGRNSKSKPRSCLGTFEESLESIDKLLNKKLIE